MWAKHEYMTIEQPSVTESDGPEVRPSTDDEGGSRTDAPHFDPLRLSIAGLGLVALVLMIIAIFLPWASINGSNQSLADYAAPQPAIVSWGLLAIGLSTAIVATGGLIFGSRRSTYGLAAGSLLYLIGTGVWYAALILPSTVAAGCNSNGGPMCNVPPGSPTLRGATLGAGFDLALIGSLLALAVGTVAPVIARWMSGQPEPE